MKKIILKFKKAKTQTLTIFIILFVLLIGLFALLNAVKNRHTLQNRAQEQQKTAYCQWEGVEGVIYKVKITESCNSDGSDPIEIPFSKEGEYSVKFEGQPGCTYVCNVQAISGEKVCEEQNTSETIPVIDPACPECKFDVKTWYPTPEGTNPTIYQNKKGLKVGRIKIENEIPNPFPTTCPDPNNCAPTPTPGECDSYCKKIYFQAYDQPIGEGDIRQVIRRENGQVINGASCPGSPVIPSPGIDSRTKTQTYEISCEKAREQPDGAPFYLHQASGNACRCYHLTVEDQNAKTCYEEIMTVCCPDECIHTPIDDPEDPLDDDLCQGDEDTKCSIKTNSCIEVGQNMSFQTFVGNNYLKGARGDFDDDFRESSFEINPPPPNEKIINYVYNDAGTYDVKLKCLNSDGNIAKSCTYRVSVVCDGSPPPPPPPPPPTSTGTQFTPPPEPTNTSTPTTTVTPTPTPTMSPACWETSCDEIGEMCPSLPGHICVDVGGNLGLRCVLNPETMCEPEDKVCWCQFVEPTPTPPQYCAVENVNLDVKIDCATCE